MKKLSESRKVLAAGPDIPSPDAKIIFTKAPFIQYEQILQDKHFRQYMEMIMVSKKIQRMGTQKTPLQKTYEINVGQEANRQFDWIELSLVYDKIDKHTTICNSYNVKMASKKIKSVKLTNSTEICSLTNEKKYYIDNLTQRHFLCKQFVAWSHNGLSVAPLSDYINNPVFQELISEGERVYLDLRASSNYVKEAGKLEKTILKFFFIFCEKKQQPEN